MSKKRHNFPVSWYVSCIVCLAYNALHFILREMPQDTCAINAHQRTDFKKREDILSCLRRTTHPSEKDWVFFVLLRRGLGAEHGKRAVTDGKGSLNKPLHVEASPNKAFEKYNPRGLLFRILQ